MNKLFLSDTHFNHGKIIEWGRTQFKTIEEHDEVLIDNINKTCSPNDILYHPGDVVMNVNENNIDEVLKRTLGRIHCKIYVALGNHDTDQKIRKYYDYVDKIQQSYDLKQFCVSHFPLYETDIQRFKRSVHGHVHENTIPDPRYFNVCCENVNYTPISYEEIIKTFKERNV